MVTISQMAPGEAGEVRDLFFEYLDWANVMNTQQFGFTIDVAALVEKNIAELDVFTPPAGRLLLARTDQDAAGVACMRAMGQQIAEIKRMYVRPMYRRQGVGGALVDALIAQSREMGNKRLRLDSARYMADAHALYRSKGFQDRPPYEGSEIPQHVQQHWVFMELLL
jgi:GNAT superfamily N-acetyltransferase